MEGEGSAQTRTKLVSPISFLDEISSSSPVLGDERCPSDHRPRWNRVSHMHRQNDENVRISR